MSRRKTSAAQAAPRCTVTVCRGCGCGTAKVSAIDPGTQLASGLDSVAHARVVNCLDACEQANVIVVQPSSAGRAAGGRPAWVGLVNAPDATADIVAWVRAGGPGIATPPEILD
ncbi:(2Fe-2S) ferredoxin domain-containing protein [Streptomyces sp. NPDC059371]|uniref:(2Fe-2S) ferredoxin domain-containing protein n=1 Tax=Streptomyces sp. NPDC059371 TaxID=3346812 RepID=UPI0036CA3805